MVQIDDYIWAYGRENGEILIIDVQLGE